MHTIEPYYRWRNLYIASEDNRSVFFGRTYSEFEFTNKIYNYLIHPQWDEFGSETLYLKILYTNYELKFTIIELLGEWNDTLYNDIMYLKREVIDSLTENGINRFILIGENVLNFHSSDDSYYEEWFADVEDGWIFGLNFQQHVVAEFIKEGIGNYILFNNETETINWRIKTPLNIVQEINNLFLKRLGN